MPSQAQADERGEAAISGEIARRGGIDAGISTPTDSL
jgi:hypothetical protein